MAVIYHEIGIWDGAWARLTIDESGTVFQSTGGAWPGMNGLSPTATPLEDAQYVYALADGRYLLSTGFVPYGIAPGAEAADLLAWKEGQDWHVKRLVVQT